VIGMNRLRHAYFEMHPHIAAYFVASPYDDRAGALQDRAAAVAEAGPIGGFGILDVADIDEALAIVKTMPAPNCKVEVRPVLERPG
jgi:hypothetical protein